MQELSIAENIIRLRHERGITQEELADFVGITKASVSKWESGKSMPDVLLLPQLAAFFGVTVDELMGYEEKLSREQIRKIYRELCTAFATKSFTEAMNEARNYAHRYYSCYPFLLQMGILYLNHAALSENEETGRQILKEALTFCDHILTRCRDASVCEDAMSLKALLCLSLGKTKDALELLETMADPSRISEQGDMMLVQAYQQAGEIERAKSYTQIRTYTHLLSMISGEILILVLYQNELERCEETIRRVKEMIELYQLRELHPNVSAQFYYQAAVVYAVNGRKEDAITELKQFGACISSILEDSQSLLHGDSYFDRLDEWIEQLPLGDMAPRNLDFARQSALQALSHPAFADIKEREEIQSIYAHINKGGKENDCD